MLACESKRIFATKAEARRVALKTMAEMGDRPMSAYRCRDCRSWHVGHDRSAPRRSFVCGACRAPVISVADRFGVDVLWDPDTMLVHGCAS